MTFVRTAAAAALLVASTLGLTSAARAEEPITITLQNDQFTPAEVKIKANTDVTIKFVNADAAAAEIEAKDLKIEKVVAGNSEVTVSVGPQEPGRYLFVNEYKEDTVKGFIVVE